MVFMFMHGVRFHLDYFIYASYSRNTTRSGVALNIPNSNYLHIFPKIYIK